MTDSKLRERVLIHVAETLHLGSTDAEGLARTGVESYEKRRVELTDAVVPMLFHEGARCGRKVWRLTQAGHAAVGAIKRETMMTL